jgi:hypothetical protein
MKKCLNKASYWEMKHIFCALYFFCKPYKFSKVNEHTIIVTLCVHFLTRFIKCENAPYKCPTKNHHTIYYTRSLTLALEILFLRITWLRRDRDGDRTQVQKKSNRARFWCTLSILISRFFTFTLNHPVRGLASDSLMKTLSPGMYFCSLIAGRPTLHSSLATVTTVAKFPKWTQF